MIQAWLVVREEKHIDTKHWVCLVKEDALHIANDVTAFWTSKYDGQGPVDNTISGEQIFFHSQEDAFIVEVLPVMIRENGEIDPEVES